MFFSSYKHNVDAKGRVFIPARWRGDLSDTVVITVDESGREEGGFLQCMAYKEWERYIDSYSLITRTNQDSMGILRVMLADAFPCEVDKQGRILIPQHLREYSGITGEALLTGVRDRIEIWEPAHWESYKANVASTQHARLEALNHKMETRLN